MSDLQPTDPAEKKDAEEISLAQGPPTLEQSLSLEEYLQEEKKRDLHLKEMYEDAIGESEKVCNELIEQYQEHVRAAKRAAEEAEKTAAGDEPLPIRRKVIFADEADKNGALVTFNEQPPTLPSNCNNAEQQTYYCYGDLQ